jgi:uncharacterized protein YjbI with pentapeptide repeats
VSITTMTNRRHDGSATTRRAGRRSTRSTSACSISRPRSASAAAPPTTRSGELDSDGATFEGELRTRGTEFHGRSNRLADNTSFAGARFQSGADFTQAGFGSVRFEDAGFEVEATFHVAAFTGGAGFRRVWFAGGSRIVKDDASVDRVTFAGRAAFDHAKFRYASFSEAAFESEAEFRHVRFDESRFVADSDVSEAQFRAPVWFKCVKFLDDANHDRDSATFVDAAFDDDADFGDVTVTSGDFQRTASPASRTSATRRSPSDWTWPRPPAGTR